MSLQDNKTTGQQVRCCINITYNLLSRCLVVSLSKLKVYHFAVCCSCCFHHGFRHCWVREDGVDDVAAFSS